MNTFLEIALGFFVYSIGMILQYIILMCIMLRNNKIKINNLDNAKEFQSQFFNDNHTGPILFFGSILWPITIVICILYLFLSEIIPHVFLWIFKND